MTSEKTTGVTGQKMNCSNSERDSVHHLVRFLAQCDWPRSRSMQHRLLVESRILMAKPYSQQLPPRLPGIIKASVHLYQWMGLQMNLVGP